MTDTTKPRSVYLAGPMTGKPAYNFPAFDYLREQWRDAGWEVVSPTDITRQVWLDERGVPFDPETDKCDYGDPLLVKMIVADLAAVLACDAIALLPGFGKSKGAMGELSLACQHGKEVYNATTFEPMPLGVSLTVRDTTEGALEEAQRLVHGDRQAAYGHPIDDYTRTGRKWGSTVDGWLRQQPGFANIPAVPDIDPRICALMMAEVKISREVNAPKRDNRVDLAGYAECADLIAQRQGAK